ncbi:MAG: VTT domain-containing protein [Aeromicrobium sp.]|uniref:VTT domain-containing protein n=1 Tax=Aeromicrobium sp. TaxID=1871063 RepID=UPI0039E5C90C
MTELGVLLAAFGFGIASATIPVFNAEAYVVANVVAFGPAMAVGMVTALSVGTTIGKVIVFHGGRSGKEFVGRRREQKPATGPVRRWLRRVNDMLMSWLEHRFLGAVTVLAASFVGVPPLLLVAFVAGMSRQNVWLFAAAVFVGRVARFGLIAGGVVAVSEGG